MHNPSRGRTLLAMFGALTLGLTLAVPAQAAPPPATSVSSSTDVAANKLDVLGIWAHPDDDASFITPCGVWSDRYDVDCGIVMLTRGEGGSNSVGDEAGPDLGLRRENEDRASHYRSGTTDIYNIDAVDFFYNTSAALTEELWGSERIQRQVVNVIRHTQPEILTGFSPSMAVGHGNHQYAGRVVWEAAAMAADPTKFPEQLTGPDAVDVWQVKLITSGSSTTGTGGSLTENCNTGFVPAANNPFTVVGTWSGYDSPYKWLEGNIQGKPAGSAMTWAQTGREGFMVHATQARPKFTGVYDPQCLRYGISQSIVPFQPNGSAANGRDDAILFGSVIADPGGMPLGSTYKISIDEYFQAPGVPFDVTVSARSGAGTIAAGTVALKVPTGWDVSGSGAMSAITADGESSVTLRVTPPADAALGRSQLSATFSNGTVTAYNDTRVELVSGVEGRFQRWGNYAEYEDWAEQFTFVGGRSNAERQLGAGESITVPVVVTNRTEVAQSGSVALTLPAGITADSNSKAYSNLAAGSATTIDFVLTHTDPASLGGTRETVAITTTSATTTSSENLTLYVVPTTVIPQSATAPTIDGATDAGYGPELNIGRKWEGADCNPDGTDCGAGSTVRLAWSGDALYAVAKVVDDKASAAATAERCFGHWLVDSVEVLIDPLGGSRDTSTTFKSGILPFTDDPTGAAGNGANGPCWSRDADNHQGFSSGPLANTIKGGPNSPGQEVAVNVTRNADGTFAGGSYTIEVKIPMANLPAAIVTGKAPTGNAATNDVDPDYLGLNVTPYDSDVQTFIGKTRTAWSPFGSQQSEPYRWGHAYLDGYTAPSGRSTEPSEPIVPDTALSGLDSPQTIYQSATRGVPISGLAPSRALSITNAMITPSQAMLDLQSTEAGTLKVFAWHGDFGMIPVWISSCVGDELGFSTCSPDDITAAPWGDDMGGRLLDSSAHQVKAGKSKAHLKLSKEVISALRDGGSLVMSWQAKSGGVNAWYLPVTVGEDPKPPVWKFERSAPYTLAGKHEVNGRQWKTTCEPYSQTERCRTDIWATTVTLNNGKFSVAQGWAFNNLTYLPLMKKEQWASNPLANSGEWTATDGRMWKTECGTPATGRDGCRSYTMTTVFKATPKAAGGYAFSQSNQWVFNNMVIFPPR